MSNLFISPVDQTMRTLAGQSFEFKAGEPTYVSPQAQMFCSAAGCVPAEEPAAEEPAAEEPAAEEPAAEEPAAEEPAAEEPAAEEPAAE